MEKYSIIIIIIILSFISYLFVDNIISKIMVNNSTYIGQEYCYTYKGEEHSNRRYYKFYINYDYNKVFCVYNNRIIKLKNIKDLEKLYNYEIKAIVMDRSNGKITYDENNIETSSGALKEKMFPINKKYFNNNNINSVILNLNEI